MSGDRSAFEALSAGIARLANGASFTAVELATRGVTVWTVSRDDRGTPVARYADFACGPDPGPGELADFYASRLAPALRRDPLLIACPSGEYPAPLLSLLLEHHRVPAYECQAPLRDHIKGAITVTPLRVGYELVVLREENDGRLAMHLRQLFPPDAYSGYNEDLTVRCEPTDEHGTVFAVMIRDRSAGATPASPRLRPVEVQSGKVPPGEYDISARLIRPGHVEFHGLPVMLTPESRPWREIVRTVPDRLPKARPAHLVCMVEVSGPEHLEHRIERIEELINAAEASGRQLKVSLVTYGPHSVERGVPGEAASVLAWATRSDLVIRQLSALKKRVPHEKEYRRAAQIECALNAVARMFAGKNPGRDGKPVLVTAGTRPPHPERVDIHSEIIPCPERISWQRTLGSLYEALPDLKFGALCNKEALGNVWTALGRDAIEEVDVVDVAAFAAKLGLRDSVPSVPFPLI